MVYDVTNQESYDLAPQWIDTTHLVSLSYSSNASTLVIIFQLLLYIRLTHHALTDDYMVEHTCK